VPTIPAVTSARRTITAVAASLSALTTLLVLAAWEAFLLLPAHRKLLLAAAVPAVLLVALALWGEERPERWRDAARRWWGRAAAARVPLALGAAALAGGLAYRLLVWPRLVGSGDSPDYDRSAAASALLGGYVSVPWRTPGYPFTLWVLYGLAGAQRYAAVHAVQIGMSLATAVLMALAAHLATGRRSVALAALAVGCFLHPLAAPAASLMTEQQATFLATLAAVLVLAIHRRRRTTAAALLLGPVLALLYETRPGALPWALVAGGAAVLLLVRSDRRRAAVVALGAGLALAPVAFVNLEGPTHAATIGPPLDLSAQALGTDRFTIYWNIPWSPSAMDGFRQAILTDGAAAEYWSGWPAGELPEIMSGRRNVMVRWVLDHPGAYLAGYLHRLPLEYRFDKRWDLTDPGTAGGAWVLVLDGLLLAAAGGLAVLARRREWVPLLLLGGLVAVHTLFMAGFHVEPRYAVPALPVVGVLAAIGGDAAVRALARALAARPRGLAVPAAAAAGLVAAVVLAEAWAWPALAAAGTPAPRAGAHQLASCGAGPHLLSSVAWQPGASRVLAGAMDGTVSWDPGRGPCRWTGAQSMDAWDIAFTRDGGRVALASYVARVADARTLAPEPPPLAASYLTGSGADVLSVSFDPTGRWLAYTAPAFSFVGIYDTGTRRVATTARLPSSPIAVRWSPDGAVIAASSVDGLVTLYDGALQPVQRLRLERPAGTLAWSPAGDRLAAGDDGGALHVWSVDGRTAAPLISTRAHAAAIRAVAFSPDGTRLATASADRTAAIWDATGLRRTRSLEGHSAGVWGVAWAPDGQRVVTAAADSSLKLWASG
jgi:WD domain, G-beta repeat